jgi:hypothetical protein
VRRFLVFGLLEGDVEDHLPAALPRRHCRQQLVAAIERTDTGRTVNLVAGQRVEIAAQRLHIDRQSRRRLAPVDQHLGAPPVRQLHDRLDRNDGAGGVRDVSDCDELGAGR